MAVNHQAFATLPNLLTSIHPLLHPPSTPAVYDTEKLSERIAKLAGGVAVIKVGGWMSGWVYAPVGVVSPPIVPFLFFS